MPVNITGSFDLNSTFSNISSAASDLAFENSFRQIERRMVEKLNSEIEQKYNDGTSEKIAKLQAERDDIAERLPQLQEYQFNVQVNQSKLADISTDLVKGIAAFEKDDDDTNLTADEVSSIKSLKEKIIDGIDNLNRLYYPDFGDGNIFAFLRADARELEDLTPVEGTVDASGSSTATNENRELLDKLTETYNRVTTAQTIAQDLRSDASDAEIGLTADIAELEVDMTTMTQVEAEKRINEVNELKAKYANILSAVSLSFEINKEFQAKISDAFHTKPPGSIFSVLA